MRALYAVEFTSIEQWTNYNLHHQIWNRLCGKILDFVKTKKGVIDKSHTVCKVCRAKCKYFGNTTNTMKRGRRIRGGGGALGTCLKCHIIDIT